MKLDQIIPSETTRKSVYVVFGAIGLILGVAQTIYASIEQGQPMWLTAAFAVYAYLAAAGFAVSTANTPTATPVVQGDGEVAEVELGQEMDHVFTSEPSEFEEVGQVTPTAAVDPADLAKHAE